MIELLSEAKAEVIVEEKDVDEADITVSSDSLAKLTSSLNCVENCLVLVQIIFLPYAMCDLSVNYLSFFCELSVMYCE